MSHPQKHSDWRMSAQARLFCSGWLRNNPAYQLMDGMNGAFWLEGGEADLPGTETWVLWIFSGIKSLLKMWMNAGHCLVLSEGRGRREGSQVQSQHTVI